MSDQKPKKQLKSFRLSTFTLHEVKRLAEEYEISMSMVLEMAVARFSQDQKRGI